MPDNCNKTLKLLNLNFTRKIVATNVAKKLDRILGYTLRRETDKSRPTFIPSEPSSFPLQVLRALNPPLIPQFLKFSWMCFLLPLLEPPNYYACPLFTLPSIFTGSCEKTWGVLQRIRRQKSPVVLLPVGWGESLPFVASQAKVGKVSKKWIEKILNTKITFNVQQESQSFLHN